MSRIQNRAQMEAYVISTLENMHRLIYNGEIGQISTRVRGKDIVIFLGNTRCGKSTVVNHVIGNRLQATSVRRNVFNIILADPTQSGPTIGVESVSETTIPTVWTSHKLDGLIVDAPGFDDNRGEAQDVANAFYIKEIITNAKSVKFVLICDINDLIHHNIGQFITFVDKFYTMLPQTSILPGVCIVFTKDKHENTRTDIVELLREKIISQPTMKVENRQLINHFVRNPNSVVVTNMPQRDGIVDEGDVFQDMIEVIQRQTQYLTLSKVVPGISDKSKCFLFEAHSRFTEIEDFNRVVNRIGLDFEKKMQSLNFNNLAEVKQILEYTDIEINKMKNVTDLYKILTMLHNILPNIAELKEGSNLYTKLKFIKFVDSVIEIEESSVFIVKIHAALAGMSNSLSRTRVKLQEKMMEISQEEANKKYQQLRDDNLKSQQEMQKKIEDLNAVNENLKKNASTKFGGMFGMIGGLVDNIIGVVHAIKNRGSNTKQPNVNNFQARQASTSCNNSNNYGYQECYIREDDCNIRPVDCVYYDDHYCEREDEYSSESEDECCYEWQPRC